MKPLKTRTSRRFRRNKREYVWTTSLLLSQTLTTTRVIIPLVIPDEWERGTVGSFQKGAVLQRIMGWISVIPFGTTTNASSIAGVILVNDFDETPGDPLVVADYADEDIFWSFGHQSGTSAADANEVYTQQVDIRSKRKLDTSRVVNLLLNSNTSAPEWRYSLMLRGLVQLP